MDTGYFSYVLHGFLLLVWALPSVVSANDNDQALFSSIYLQGDSYDWQQPAWDNGSSRFDTYLSSSSGYSVTVETLLDAPNLGIVQGSSSWGSVNGYLDNGTYYAAHSESGTPGYYSWETWDYTADLSLGQLSWVHNSSYTDGMGNDSNSWDDSNGQWGSYSHTYNYDGMNNITREEWSDSTGNSGYHEWGNSATAMSGSDIYLLGGIDYICNGGSSWYEIASDGTNNSGNSYSYYAFDGSGSVTVSNSSISDGTNSVTDYLIEGSDVYLGAYRYHTSSADGGATGWDPRTAPSFGPSNLWIDGWMVSWQSGVLADDGTVTDTYADVDNVFSFVVTGSARSFAMQTSSATVLVNGGSVGSVDPTMGWSLGAWTVDTEAPTQTSGQPFFLPGKMSLWVGGSVYVFEAGYSDNGGQHLDQYHNAGLGYLRLTGTGEGVAHVVGNLGTQFFWGTLNGDGSFTIAPDVGVTTSGPFELLGQYNRLWVNGVVYTRYVDPATSEPTNDYYNSNSEVLTVGAAGADQLSISGSLGTWTCTGTIAKTATGLFLLNAVNGGGGADTFPALWAQDDVGEINPFVGVGSPTGSAVPAVVMMGTDVLVYLGCMPKGADTYACFGVNDAGSCTRLLEIQQLPEPLAAGAQAGVVWWDCSAAEGAGSVVGAGTYDPVHYVFQTEAAASTALPQPLYAADAAQSHARLLFTVPEGSNLPPSFIVNHEAWWYVGDGVDGSGNPVSTYRGFFNGQVMTLGALDAAGQRLVTLTDPVHNNGSTTSTEGTLSSQRGSVRLRDGTMAFSGTDQGGQEVVQHTDDFKLQTIAADLDIVGNNLSFGILRGDASLAGALLQFADLLQTNEDNSTTSIASLSSILSRPQAQWQWARAEDSTGQSSLPVMKLDAASRLTLYDSTSGAAGVVLDPTPDGVSTIRGVLRVRPGGDIDMGEFSTSPEGLTAP